MDSFYHDLKQVGRLFDDVFGNVFSITSCEPTNPIDVSTLSDQQLLNVYDGCKILHEVLHKYRENRASDTSPHARKRKLSEVSDPLQNGCKVSIVSDYEKEKKKTLILREYLIQELNYSEKLELELLEKKEELANAIRREEISKKQHESRILELLAYNNEYQNDDGATNESIIGHFIHKPFGEYGTYYGLISSFDHPYYKIIYEDGDAEELSRSEAMAYLVNRKEVPDDIIQACNEYYDQIEQGKNPHVTPRLTTDLIPPRNREF